MGTLGGRREKLCDPCPLDGERVLVRLGKANRLARFLREVIGIVCACPVM